MTTGFGFSPMSTPADGSMVTSDTTSKWYKRWYVWVLPIAVAVGAFLANR